MFQLRNPPDCHVNLGIERREKSHITCTWIIGNSCLLIVWNVTLVLAERPNSLTGKRSWDDVLEHFANWGQNKLDLNPIKYDTNFQKIWRQRSKVNNLGRNQQNPDCGKSVGWAAQCFKYRNIKGGGGRHRGKNP